MKRTYYVVPQNSHTTGHHHLFKEWAALDNPDGTSLLSVKFHDEDCCESFESHACVQPLAASGPICASHAACLCHLGVTPTDTLQDVIAKARVKYKAM